jgi:hypothetical protein
MFEDSALRLLIYDEIVRTGETPAVAMLARLVSAPLDDVRASLRRMHDAHMLVLQPTGDWGTPSRKATLLLKFVDSRVASQT